MTPQNVFDLILVATVVAVARRALYARVLFEGIVFYIGFGLLLAIIWVRLRAPDLALTEAAVGAGITGAMLIDAARQFVVSGETPRWAPRYGVSLAAILTIGLASLLAVIVASPAAPDIRPIVPGVFSSLSATGVSHPVTAVLLAFRGYDTWLEVGVLLVAAIGILVARRGDRFDAADGEGSAAVSPVAVGSARLIAAVGVLVASYLLWRGTHAPGGAFQAGATLGALGVLLSLVGRSPVAAVRPLTLRLLLTVGFGVFLLVGAAGILTAGSFLGYPRPFAGVLILAVESAVTVSVAATLVLLFAGGRPPWPDRGERPG